MSFDRPPQKRPEDMDSYDANKASMWEEAQRRAKDDPELSRAFQKYALVANDPDREPLAKKELARICLEKGLPLS